MYVLKTVVPNRAGQEQHIPFLRLVTVSEEGTVETESLEDALGLHDSNCGYFLVDEKGDAMNSVSIDLLRPSIEAQVVGTDPIAEVIPSKPIADLIVAEPIATNPATVTDPIAAAVIADPTAANGAVNDNAQESGEDEEAKKAALVATYDAFNAADLKDKAKAAGLPGGEWRALVKEDLINYLIEKGVPA